MSNIITVHVRLLEEETPVLRPTKAMDVGNGLYKLLATEAYDPENEVWEFLPGSIIKIEKKMNFGKEILLAVGAGK